jgi:hypothetical protein
MKQILKLSNIEIAFLHRIDLKYHTNVSQHELEKIGAIIQSNWTDSGCTTHIDVPHKFESDSNPVEYRGIFSLAENPNLDDQFFIEAIFDKGWPYGIFITNTAKKLPRNPVEFHFLGEIEQS